MTFLGVDTGGTFTDFVLFDGGQLRVHKVLSTPDAPEQAILAGIRDLQIELDPELVVVHGSTVATNAVLEGKGVRTVYITNQGLRDVLTIGRQARKELYNLQPMPQTPPVPRELCLEVPVRIAADGERLQSLTDAALQDLCNAIAQCKPQAVAINLLFSFIDDTDERTLAALIPGQVFVSCSADILPVYGEYERGMATWLNSYVGPLMQGYLSRLQTALAPARLAIMQSSGGTISAEQAGSRAVNLLLSGPAGGLAAARAIGRSTGQQRLLTFDMGGTSTDVALIHGELTLTSEAEIGGYPVAVPMVDMHTIGAGGGSIAYVDAGGLLCVGPQSAGASPGPACYGQGGTQPTVTDANLILGRLRADAFLGGGMQLDVQAAEQAMFSLAENLEIDMQAAAEGIITLANEHMARALRVMSIQRGEDPREYTLLSFGGAGGLHVCALADALQMTRAMVPANAGVLSALGMLYAPPSRQLTQTLTALFADISVSEIEAQFDALITQGRQALLQEGVSANQMTVRRSLDLRYRGQSYTLNIPWQSVAECMREFHVLHQQRYGHDLDLPIELVNLQVGLYADALLQQLPVLATVAEQPAVREIFLPGVPDRVQLLSRDALRPDMVIHGPALITEQVSTTWIAAGWQCQCDDFGNLVLVRQ